MYFSNNNPSNRKRTHHIQVWLDDEEYQQLNIMVAYTSQSREAVLRDLISGLTVKEKPPVEFGEILRELRYIGSNVNQMTATLHAHGFANVPQIEKVAKQLESIENRLIGFYTKER